MLELGCGAGVQAARLAAIGYEVIGVDIAPDAIKYARETYGTLNPRLGFHVQANHALNKPETFLRAVLQILMIL